MFTAAADGVPERAMNLCCLIESPKIRMPSATRLVELAGAHAEDCHEDSCTRIVKKGSPVGRGVQWRHRFLTP